MTAKRITVLGGTGFLGRSVCARLAASGVEVTSMSRNLGGGQSWRHVVVDIEDALALPAALAAARPQIIYHLAGLASARSDRALMVPMLFSHVLSTVRVLEYATTAGCERVILASSLEEPDPSELAPVASSPYAAAKWTAGVYGRMYQQLHNTPVVFARVFMAYGPGTQNLTKLVPYAALSLIRGELPLLSSGVRAFDWIYIDDAAAGLVSCANARNVDGQYVDIGTGMAVTVKTVVNLIAEMTDSRIRPSFGALPDRWARTARQANVDETYRMIGWRSGIDLTEGLRRTVEWFKTSAVLIREAPRHGGTVQTMG